MKLILQAAPRTATHFVPSSQKSQEEKDGLSAELTCIRLTAETTSILMSRCFLPTKGLTLERWQAYWSGFADAAPIFVANADKRFGGALLEPRELFKVHTQLLLDERCQSREQFAERTRDPALFDILDARYMKFLEEVRPETPEELQLRRERACDEAMQRFPQVAEHVLRTHGLKLPRHIALGWALMRSLAPGERKVFDAALGEQGMSAVTLAGMRGIFPLFEEGGLERPTKPGMDVRLHLRRSYTPPELLPLFFSDFLRTEVQHGLFYDDPAFLPSGIAKVGCTVPEMDIHRGSRRLDWVAETFFDFLRRCLYIDLTGVTQGEDDDYPQDQDQPEEERVRRKQHRHLREHRYRLIRDAITGFAEHEARIREEDRAQMRWSFAERSRMAPIASGEVGIATDLGDASDLPYLNRLRDLNDVWMSPTKRLRKWISDAEVALKAGDPRHALALGRDLYVAGERGRIQGEDAWFEAGMARPRAVSLLTAAYRALGREALARIAELPGPAEGDTVDIYPA